MLSDKNVIGIQFVLFTFLCYSCVFCTQRIDYVYEDITITRIEHLRYSTYYCNNSDENHRIQVYGYDNLYRACLVIDKNTKKVWIVNVSCRMEQPNADYRYFQADIQGDPIDIWKLPHHCMEDTEQKYECYDLMGVGFSKRKRERECNRKRFLNTKIQVIESPTLILM